MAENGQPIIVKKVKKSGGHGHHGGSWKVAYADFVTAMMAFFLLLWLLSASNTSTLEGIASYFKNPSMVHAAGGASTSVIKIGKHVDAAKGDGDRNRESDEMNNESPQSAEFQRMELIQLEDLKAELEREIDNSASLQLFKEQLLLDITEDGLRIQIVDKDNRPMFDLGSADMKWYAKKILRQFAPILKKVNNGIQISGHTDAKQYISAEGYTNWELSSDRANAARRELVAGSYPMDKISQVMGLASNMPFDPENPDNPINRRISIVVLKKSAEEELLKNEDFHDAPQAPSFITPIQFEDAIRSGTIRRSGTIVREE